MAIIGQTPLTTIAAAQPLELAYQPILLAEITFINQAVLRLSTENLSSTMGGIQYQGNDYYARILNQSIETLQSLSDNGIVQSPEVTLELADADKSLWTNWEFALGFKGAKLKLILVFWDPGTSTFSSDSRVMFVGICNPANATPTELSVTATSILQMSRSFLPTVAISQLCPWTFPPDLASRTAGANDPASIFYQCGYSPDVAGGVGNGSFTDCGKGWSDCIARLGNASLSDNSKGGALVQIMYDQSMRRTGRFGGIRWSPPSVWSGKEYITGNKAQGIDNPNVAKYNDYFPMIYGKAMVTPPVMNVAGDPNSTRFEVVVCVGQIHTDLVTPGPVEAVLVNGLLIPHISQTSDPLMAWFWVNNGSRTGSVNPLPIYDGRGDPYGSLACLCIVVYKDVQDSSGTPNVQVLTKGPAVLQYPDATTGSQTLAWTDSPAWNTLDMLTRCNFQTTDVDLATFAAEAAYAATNISYIGLNGASGTHPRYRMGFSLRERRSLSDVLKTVLAGYNAILRPSLTDGTIQLLIKKSFANQQTAAIVGSNNQSAIAGGGYSAYDFSESSIKLTDGNGFEDTARVPTLSISQRRITDTPNRLTLTYQDEDYSYNSDTLVMVDSGDIIRAGGQMIAGNEAAEGIVNYDQATRIIQSQFAENYRGNPRTGASYFNGVLQNDSGGTYILDWRTTFKGLHLRCGDLIRLSMTMYGLNLQGFRITAIKPSMNYEEAQITANWHADEWYGDTYGQRPAPTAAGQGGLPNRPPFGWCPDTVTPASGDAIHAATDLTFTLSENWASSSTGVISAQLNVGGKLPANQLSSLAAPIVTTATAGGGGSIPAGTYFFAASAIDSSGFESPLNLPPYPSATLTGTGSITLSGFTWPNGTVASKIFGGSDPQRMSLQATGATPSTVTLTALNVATEGAPDKVFDHFSFVATRDWHPGVFYAPVASVSSGSVSFANASFGGGQFVGSVLSLIGSANSLSNVPVVDATISGSGGSSISVSGVDLVAAGVKVGDYVTVRATGASVTDTSIGDPDFVSSMYTPEPPVAVQFISNAGPIQVTSKTPHGYSSGDFIVISLLYGAPKIINGNQYTVTVIDTLNFTLNGSSAAGLYAGGGITQRLTIGMRTNAETGRMLRIIAGTGKGQTYPIASNTQTTVTISGSWITTPDSTSIWIITDSSPTASVQTASISNADPTQTGAGAIPLTDITPVPYFVQAFTMSGQEVPALASDSPFREIYLFPPPQNLDTGLEGTPVSTVPPTSQQVLTYNSVTNQWEGQPGFPQFADDITPTGAIDGTNVTYTLPTAPNPSASLSLYRNGDWQNPGLDYTLTSATITVTTPLIVGEWLRAFFRYV